MKNTYNIPQLTVYVDMDGVIADFDKKTKELIGKSLDEFPTSAEGWAAMNNHKDIYSLLEPMPDALELIEGILDLRKIYDFRLEVLTAIPKIGRIPTAKQDKVYWIEKHFPGIFDQFNIGPNAEHKQYHCVTDDVLIDDSVQNIPQWNSKGGLGILHTRASDSLLELYGYLSGKYGV
jgi:5'(3')-deoxyribonucleotidase